MIPAYLDILARELEFDRSLSRAVCREVEDHLREAVAADGIENTLEAERRAIARFGDPRAIAAQFAMVSLANQTRRAGLSVLLVVAGVFVAMKVRVVWYAAAQWGVADDMVAVTAQIVRIDRYAFWLSVIIGLGAWIYVRSRQIPNTLDLAYHGRLRRFFVLCAAAAIALVVVVISDGLLTALQLRRMAWSAQFIVPIVSMAIEILGVGFLALHIRRVTARAAFVARSWEADRSTESRS